MPDEQPRYSSVGGGEGIAFGGKLIGSERAIYVDDRQPDMRHDLPPGVVVTRLPVGDYVFVTPASSAAPCGQVVVVEEKKLDDLYSSWTARRLQRQLREVRAAGDVAVLALRGTQGLDTYLDWLNIELVKWQAIGGLVVSLPPEQSGVFAMLSKLREVLPPGAHLYTVVAGEDRRVSRKAKTPVGRALATLLTGVGPVLGDKLSSEGDHDIVRALKLEPATLRRLGVRTRTLEHLRILRNLPKLWLT